VPGLDILSNDLRRIACYDGAISHLALDDRAGRNDAAVADPRPGLKG